MKTSKVKVFLLIISILFLISFQIGFAQEQIVLKAGTDQPPSEHWLYKSFVIMRENLEKFSDGRVTIKIFDSSKLGDEQDMMEQLKIGSLDLLTSSFPNASRFFPKLTFFSLAYLFESYDHINNVMQNPEVKSNIESIVEERKEGVFLLDCTSSGARYQYCGKPILRFSDMRGQKIRVMTNPVESRTWEAFGAIPDPMPFSEIYNALQTGVIDGGENSLTAIYNNNFYEVSPYINLTQHQFAVAGMFMSEKSYNNLPEDVQKMVDKAATIAAIEGFELSKNNDAEFLWKLLNKTGVVVTATDKSEFIKAAEPIQKEIAQELDLMDMYELIKNTK